MTIHDHQPGFASFPLFLAYLRKNITLAASLLQKQANPAGVRYNAYICRQINIKDPLCQESG
ncbi:MAG: hypothetical protein R6U19_07525 [Bacteroidales bacterium]